MRAPRLRFIHEDAATARAIPIVPRWVRERETARRDRIEGWRTADEKEKASGMRKGEREKRPPGAEIAVSILAFISVSAEARREARRDATLKVSGSSRARRNKPRKRGGSIAPRINPKRVAFDRPSLPISHARPEKRKRKNTDPIYGDPLEWIALQIRARRSCHSCVINCPVELGRDSN